MYKLRRACGTDMYAIHRMITDGRASLKSRGVDQWQDFFPGERDFARDIALAQLWVLTDDANAPIAVAALCFGEDPSYRVITEGDWLGSLPYAAIHRVAVSNGCKGRGVAGILFRALCGIARDSGCRTVRIDTHEDNASMRRALEKSGFAFRGRIRTTHGSPRVAYEKDLLITK
ncbi:MAG: GNAT family N-acetyltransferase [Clostridiaceae bacterium]|nr:GNAT family N-acetyltransferase [Clostridiaceae bacterium]